MQRLFLPLIVISVSIIGMVGCATTSKLSTANNVSVAKLDVGTIKVNLTQKYNNPTFYSQAEIEQYLNQCMTSALTKQGKYQPNAPAHLNLTVDYKRVYAGEAFGMKKSIGNPWVGYRYQIVSNQQVLQQQQKENLIATAGFLDSMNYTGKTDKEDEDKYLNAICQHVAHEIK